MLRPSSAIAAALALAAQCLVVSPAAAQDFRDRPEVAALKAELVAEHGFDAASLDATFAKIRRLDRVVALMDAPIRAPTPWHIYWPRHIGGDRLQRGSEFLRANRASFESAAHAYGVDFFRGELKDLLLLAREQNKSPFDFTGSFAGAMGWPQFMPGSYRRWAVDFDNDQKIDLWNSPADIIGSVASFLSGHGWQRGEPVMLPVAKPSAEIIATFDGGLAPRKPLKDYLAAGVRITAKDSDVTLPADDAQVGLISLDRADGSDEYWLVFENFYVITRYNRSRMAS